MTTTEIREMLLWCTGINYAILIVWFAVFVKLHDCLYRMHARWFKLSVESFDALNYGGIAIYKVGVVLFNLVPLIALYLSS